MDKTYAHYNGEKIISIHHAGIWTEAQIPEPRIEISDEEREKITADMSSYFVVDGAIVYDPAPKDNKRYKRSNGNWIVDADATAEANTQKVKTKIADIDQQILAIEATQPRQIREITLGLDDGSAQATLVKSNEMIGLLRKDRAALIANRR